MRNKLKQFLIYPMSLLYVVAGANHFIKPEFYKQLMPTYLPYHYEIIFISGVFEVALGLGLIFMKTRRTSAWGIVALLIAVYPANIYMWMNNVQIDGHATPALFHYIRLPMQFVLLYWAYLYTKKTDTQL
jgi:uncharacterized membrane protein